MKKLLIGLALCISGCEGNQRPRAPFNATFDTGILIYTKDPRTGLCFAWANPGYNDGVMANVPCTAEVERLVVR